MKTLIAYSHNGESFDYETQEEAAADLVEREIAKVGDEVTIDKAEFRRPKPSEFCNTEQLLEAIGSNAYDECHEWSDGWPMSGMSEDDIKEFGVVICNAIDEWLGERGKWPTFYKLVKGHGEETVTITEDML